MSQTINELVEQYTTLQAEQKADAVTNAAFVERRKLRTAEMKELKFTLMQALATDHEVDEIVVGDMVLTRTSKPKVLCTEARLKQHLGEGFGEYVDNNVEVNDTLTIRKQKRRRGT